MPNTQYRSTKKLLPLALAASLAIAPISGMAQQHTSLAMEQEPGMLAMYTDLILLRPVGLVTTVFGAAAYVVSLPFTLPVGGATQAGKTLVADPAKFTFARCLGCTRTGYNKRKEEVTAEE